jgi:hypothetical protein
MDGPHTLAPRAHNELQQIVVNKKDDQDEYKAFLTSTQLLTASQTADKLRANAAALTGVSTVWSPYDDEDSLDCL